MNGSSRRWLRELELEDALEPERADDIDGEPEHDGWSPIRPRRPLARLGDVAPALARR
ncbi:MAG TPA: hypothetical protein RMH85_20840 [Polyangiaceae bacterium LLY-WYZ-15_(1-7)]|nr:hypothetical protein [Polyangiaceae bacterium LLY-WYZ-15_(1-7)]HJL03697.1 hypothetical protein [Polyangiaceae bacterium LLY-WYZ-15_(1-7)]HJL10934.1 hypothetical protein [Polyangiaceae bacterium LLY-WYZ-15_(1-7)]HJL24648.1 hypothetical protein [Polyangiaceae bacterium LLY-WYZ-15_(1-7)]HJL45904.1 hypothetical protein [Polyangiaceae bacterium LLY-WYZ-15_(1-7)]